MTTRKQYSKEFRLDAIALVVEQKYSRVEGARNLGLSPQIHKSCLKGAKTMLVMLLELMANYGPSQLKLVNQITK